MASFNNLIRFTYVIKFLCAKLPVYFVKNPCGKFSEHSEHLNLERRGVAG